MLIKRVEDKAVIYPEGSDVQKIAEIVGFDNKYTFQRKWVKKSADGSYLLSPYKVYQIYGEQNKFYTIFLQNDMRYLDISEVARWLRIQQNRQTTLTLASNDVLLELDSAQDRFIQLKPDTAINPDKTYYVIRVFEDHYDVFTVDSLLLSTILYLENQKGSIDFSTVSAQEILKGWQEQSRQRFLDLWR